MIAEAASLPVISTFEPEQRMYWMPISSAMLRRRWFRTSNAAGSRSFWTCSRIGRPSLAVRHQDVGVAVGIDARGLAVEHDDGGAGVLDHGRAGDAVLRLQREAVVDR